MSCTNKSATIAVTLVAIVLALICADAGTQAQKTAANSFQQAVGSNQNSAYGGYGGQSSSFQQQRKTQSTYVAPVNQQRRVQQQQQSYKRTESVQQRQPVYQQQQEVASSSSSSSSSYEQDQQAEADAEPASYGAVQGKPGQDFPAYTQVPKTSFSCEGQPYDYGMYADEETGCQAYHVCYNGRKDSFLCGVGTVFNQRILHCDYWYSVECGKSSQYYSSNAYMGSSQPEPGPAQAGPAQPAVQQSQQSSNSYSRSTSVQRPAAPSNNNYQRAQSFRNTQQQQVDEGY